MYINPKGYLHYPLKKKQILKEDQTSLIKKDKKMILILKTLLSKEEKVLDTIHFPFLSQENQYTRE